jgi:NADH:ubiquinone oxidoreductase subunit K
MDFLRSMNILLLIQLPYIFTLVAFISQHTHLLIALLCLEGIILSLVLIIPSILSFSNIPSASIYALILLTIGACEAGLGLRLIVNISRSTGSDLMKSVTLNKC